MEWKQNEINFLIKNYKILGRGKCSEKLERTTDSISSKIRDLKLKIKSKKLWLDTEILFLKKNQNSIYNKLVY